MTRLDNPHLEPGEEPRKESGVGTPAVMGLDAASEPETCEECGDEVGRLSVEHPAHDAVFCSHSCKSTWFNKLHGTLR